MPLFETLASLSIHKAASFESVNGFSSESSSVTVNAAAAPKKQQTPAPVTSSFWSLDRVEDGKCKWNGDRQGIRKLFRRKHIETLIDPRFGTCRVPQTKRSSSPTKAAPKKK